MVTMVIVRPENPVTRFEFLGLNKITEQIKKIKGTNLLIPEDSIFRDLKAV